MEAKNQEKGEKKMSYDKCPFCDMGQAKRMMIWRLTKNLSRSSIQEIISNRNLRSKSKIWKEKIKKDHEHICPKCGKNCGNAGLLAMHMNSPGKPYRNIHNKYDKQMEVKNE